MRIPGLKTARQVVRQVRSRLLGGVMILGYHRISEEGEDPFSMSVSPKNFAEQLAAIRDLATPVSLPALGQGLRNGDLLRQTIALTMDDGYADNLHKAQPLLERYEIPATVFVVSGNLGQEFWWDELARLVFTEGAFEDDVCLVIAGREIAWRMQAGKDVYKQKRQLLQILYRAIRTLTELERRQSIKQVRGQIKDVQLAQPRYRALTGVELNILASCPLMEIGSHTLTHPVLAGLTCTAQQDEIQQSKAQLEALLDRPIKGFSYPNGSFATETTKLVQDAGFAYACASDNDVVWQSNDPFSLPRFWIPNWDGEQFSHWLNKWL